MLLTVEYYRQITGDTASASAEVETAASAAQELLEDAIGRRGTLEHGTHVETCPYFENGTIYPSATPIESVTGGPLVIDNVVYGAQPDVNVFTGFFPFGVEPRYVTLTYVVGYTSVTVPEYVLQDLAWATRALLNPAGQALIADLNGADSATVGDVTVGFGRRSEKSVTESAISWSQATRRLRRIRP